MSNTKTISRKDILQAIRTEPLLPGAWIHSRFDDKKSMLVLDDECPVCAVGAVLRKAGIVSYLIATTAAFNVDSAFDYLGGANVEEMKAALQEGAYLNALSMKFEKLAKTYGVGKRTRDRLVKFVKANFPKEIEIKT